jgi:catechol 2,3-dioxygenase-like lactoylglutathione lyase family enzyme
MSRFTWNALLATALLGALAMGGCAPSALAAEPLARGVGCIGLTVSDVDRSAEFYTHVLDFRREKEVEVAGESWEHLSGVFGMRARTVRVRLGAECLDLTEFLAPRGRPGPADARSNDRSFQHVAIVVTDMDEAYRRLRGEPLLRRLRRVREGRRRGHPRPHRGGEPRPGARRPGRAPHAVVPQHLELERAPPGDPWPHPGLDCWIHAAPHPQDAAPRAFEARLLPILLG